MIEYDPEALTRRYPGKFAPDEKVFDAIRRGDHLYVGTGCGEPQHLLKALAAFVDDNPKAFFDAEVFQVWTLGVAPYAEEKFLSNFRHNSFFIGDNTRQAVNEGLADYTPVFLSEVPDLFRRGLVPIDVALIQASPPDRNGYMSLGVSVDITKAAVEVADRVICQVNPRMPRVFGDSFIHVEDATFLVHFEEPLLEYTATVPGELARKIGGYVARIVEDGDTIQVGYGSIPNAILAGLAEKKHLGVHTELLSDGIVDLTRSGAVDNSMKAVDKGKTVATFCMGTAPTYEFIGDNPSIEFRPIDRTNNPLVIAANSRMTAINGALAVDLTGQSTAESIGPMFYSGIGGQADFMRGAVLSPGGKSILVLPSTTADGETSRIVPSIPEGAGVTLTRGDIHYVVTEYGIAYLHGKNIRQRAMELIAIAHPRFRQWLIDEAKGSNLIYSDQIFVSGKEGEYPEELEKPRTTRAGLEILLRPVRMSDEPLIKDFFYSLSDQSNYRRFIMLRQRLSHEVLQKFVAIDYTREMAILATVREEEMEKVVGMGQYVVTGDTHTAEVALAVRDDHQKQGIGTELLQQLERAARRQGLLGFTAVVLGENRPVMKMLERSGYDVHKSSSEGVVHLTANFR
ncbi:MAG: GNAT family N-acetyltransferase [Actinobacteria bacterium]|nr:GNAT family N-acetyltransferase [Actinomycetota bacterium]MBU1942553.1 GNAT family N-acetyltransferase [Actinomycetota bacterium]MBU2687202.1 GNAT family N-acetyltransferase [Actinomycetota bacterium]